MLETLPEFNQFPLLQDLKMTVQIPVREPTEVFQITEQESFRVSNQRSEHAEARALVDQAIEALIAESAGRHFRLFRFRH